MVNQLIKYGIMFVVLVLIQVLILNHIQFSGFVNPYIYLLFVLLLPLTSPKYIVLLLAFMMGLTVDIFSNSLGIHSFATVFAAFFRPSVIRLISTREEDRNEYPGLKQNKFQWFSSYVIIMVLIHHFVLFYIEVFTFSNFLVTLTRTLISSASSIFVIILSQYIVFRD